MLGPKILAEEIPRLPLRTLRVLRDVISHQEIDLHELHCGVEAQWLIHIIRRSVVAGRDPLLRKLLPVYRRIFSFFPLGIAIRVASKVPIPSISSAD